MPQNINDDDIVIGDVTDETEPASTEPDVQAGQKPVAPNNLEASSDTTPSAEELNAKLKAKAKNERQLGSVASKAMKSLVQRAVDGDTDAIKIVQDDPELISYVEKKFPEEIDLFKTEKKESKEDIKESIKRDLRKESQMEKVKNKLSESIKGKDNFDKALSLAETLLEKGESIENASRVAVLAVNGDSQKLPTIPRGVKSNVSSDAIILSKSKILKMGLDPKLVEKQAREGKLSQTTLNFIKK